MAGDASVVLIFCEPIIDFVLEVESEFLEAYGLEDEAFQRYDATKHRDLFEVVRSHADTKVLPGGIGQNSARVCQALSPGPHRTAFAGTVGSDAEAKMMLQRAETAGLAMRYAQAPGRTSACAVLISKRSRGRSMVTRIDASSHFSAKDVPWQSVKAARIIHAGGLTAAAYPSVISEIASYCAKTSHKLWVTSLGAPWLLNTCYKILLPWMRQANLVCGNEEEWQAFAQQQQEQIPKKREAADIRQIISQVCEDGLSSKVARTKPRIIVATRGHQSTLVARAVWQGSQIAAELHEFPVCFTKAEEVVDTNGCGDAFLGGFLYAWSCDADLKLCVEVGHRCARDVLMHRGCDFDLRDLRSELQKRLRQSLCFRSASASTSEGSVTSEDSQPNTPSFPLLAHTP